MLHMPYSSIETFRVWKRSCISAIRGVSSSLFSPSRLNARGGLILIISLIKEERMLRDPGLNLRRWLRFFSALLNAKLDKLESYVIEGLPERAFAHALGVEPTEHDPIVFQDFQREMKHRGGGELP